MQWQEIRQYYPYQRLLLEAVKAHSEGDQRIPDQLAVLDAFSDSAATLSAYARLHREIPDRELYVFHTSRDTLDIREQHWLGIRSAR